MERSRAAVQQIRPANPDNPDAGGCPRVLSLLIAAQAGVVLLAGLNIAWAGTRASLPMGEFVRWRELLSLGIFTPLSMVLQFLVVWTLERGRRDATGPLTLFVLAVCWLSVSMGVHEPIIALIRAGGPRLADSLWFWKEVFSHASCFALTRRCRSRSCGARSGIRWRGR